MPNCPSCSVYCAVSRNSCSDIRRNIAVAVMIDKKLLSDDWIWSIGVLRCRPKYPEHHYSWCEFFCACCHAIAPFNHLGQTCAPENPGCRRWSEERWVSWLRVCIGWRGRGNCRGHGARDCVHDVRRGRRRPGGVFHVPVVISSRLPRPSSTTHSEVKLRLFPRFRLY